MLGELSHSGSVSEARTDSNFLKSKTVPRCASRIFRTTSVVSSLMSVMVFYFARYKAIYYYRCHEMQAIVALYSEISVLLFYVLSYWREIQNCCVNLCSVSKWFC